MSSKDFTYTGIELDSLSYAVNYNQWITAPFIPLLRGRVVEVGAGRGTLTPILSAHSEQYLAVEPDETNFVSLKDVCDKLGVDCFNGFSSAVSLRSNSVNTFT